MMMPPMKVTQRAAPNEVAKHKTWKSFARETASAGESALDPKTSGAKTTPAARNATAVRNRVDQAIGVLQIFQVGGLIRKNRDKP